MPKNKIKVVRAKSPLAIASEWDAIAPLRERQIAGGADISYNFILLPTVMRMCRGADTRSVVDVGCGVGILTKQIAVVAREVLGIDPSPKSIELAGGLCASLKNVRYANESIEAHARRLNSPLYTLAIANMTLIVTPNLGKVLDAVHKILVPGGILVVTLAHPCFWPQYWGYLSSKWFDYSKELLIEAPFKISGEGTDYITTHIHRPLEMYFDTLLKSGFEVVQAVEPMPNKNVASKYSSSWKYPRFLGIKCLRK